MCGSRKFCQEGPILKKWGGGRAQKQLKVGHHRPTSEAPQ